MGRVPRTLAIALALFCGQLAITTLARGALPARATAARCALAALLLLLAALARLGPRAGLRLRRVRRSPRAERRALAGGTLLAAAALAFVVGALELWLAAPGREVPLKLMALGLSPAAWLAARPLGFELCGLLAVLSLCACRAHALAEGRVRDALPPAGRSAGEPLSAQADLLDVIRRALGVGSVAFAIFAAALHATLGAGPLSPAPFTVPIAVLAGSSLAAFWLAAPVARALALSSARGLGIPVRDPATLERLARVDVVCVDADPGLTSDAALAVRALGDRGVAVHLFSERRAEATRLCASWIGARAVAPPGAAAAALHVRDLQVVGAWVAVIGPCDGPAAARADLALALPGELLPLAHVIDVSRALRARLREGAALATLFNAALIPCAALGLVPPAAAALLALAEALLVLGNALRIPRRAGSSGGVRTTRNRHLLPAPAGAR